MFLLIKIYSLKSYNIRNMDTLAMELQYYARHGRVFNLTFDCD